MKSKSWIMRICFALLSIGLLLAARPPRLSQTIDLASEFQPAVPIEYHMLPTSREIPGIWQLANAVDPIAPELLIKGQDGYKLLPNWQVATIDFSYIWAWPLPDEQIHTLQTLKFAEGAYHNGDTIIPESLIKAFLDSLDHLYPSNDMVRSITASDDDPVWRAEMVGQDGTHIFLYSNSTLIGATPWNVIYNGSLYVQYEGNIADTLTKLFPLPESKFSPPARIITDTLSIKSWGRPNTLQYGFTGLFPIAQHYSYRVDRDTKRIESTINPLVFLDAFEAMTRGKIDKLERVELILPENTLPCSIASEPYELTPNLVRDLWTFTCSLEKGSNETYYRYPIHIQFGTNTGESISTQGELYGSWDGNNMSFSTPPVEVIAALQAYPPASDLLNDHILDFDLYVGSIDRSKGPRIDTFIGQATLLGQAEVNGVKLKYTAWTVVYMEDGQITRWDLDRNALDQMLMDIFNLDLFQRVLNVSPGPTLNIWYSVEAKEAPAIPTWDFSDQIFRSINVAACPPLPGEGKYPRANTPLRGFGFNQSTGWNWRIPFMLADGKPMVYSFILEPDESNSELWLNLIPNELQIADHPLPTIVHFRTNDFESGPFFGFMWDPKEVSQGDIDAYNALGSKLPSPIEKSEDAFFTRSFFSVTPDGQLQLVSCESIPTTTPINAPDN